MQNHTRRARHSLTVMGACLALFSLAGCRSITPIDAVVKPLELPSPYNVVWLTGESLRADHVHCLGYERETTPHIDALAATGALFSKCFTASAWTSENMVAYFLGVFSPVHGVDTRNKSVPAEWYAPLEQLRDAGYQVPRMQAYQADVNYNHLGFVGDITHMEPDAWIRQHGSKPFFMWYHILDTHLPYRHGLPDAHFWSDDLVPNEAAWNRIQEVATNGVLVRGTVEFKPEEDRAAIVALYDDEILRMDRTVGNVVAALEETGLRTNTILILSADHAEEMLDHGFVGHASTSKHGTLFDDLTHIPLVISLPGRVPAEVLVTNQVRAIDILPTVWDYLELAPLPWFQGTSLQPVIVNPETATDRTVFLATSLAGYKEDNPADIKVYLRAVRTPQWKLVCTIDHGRRSYELYDLNADPDELTNVIDSHKEVAATLRKHLLRLERECRAPRSALASAANMEPEYRESFWQKLARVVKPGLSARDLEGVPSPPEFTYPPDGTILTAVNTGGALRLEWQGVLNIPYVVEFEVGQGDYLFEGTLRATGPKLTRTFSEEYWNQYVVQYDPARFRVKVDHPDHAWSEWRTFRLK